MARERAFIISGHQWIPGDTHSLEVVGADSVGLAQVGERSLFTDHPGSALTLTPGTDHFHRVLLRSDTQDSARPTPYRLTPLTLCFSVVTLP
ncbi:protein of unknown function [Nitrospira defluvii]|uniref:Uncharacterized protein n=1 Tax=Nitrospira defluvii TaxID=330214 RepID=D8P8X2_9BACT|nr:protein of unknown function [Nitrospira defluvii]